MQLQLLLYNILTEVKLKLICDVLVESQLGSSVVGTST
jgi:hypothetical protein